MSFHLRPGRAAAALSRSARSTSSTSAASSNDSPCCFCKTITVMCLRESQASEGGDPLYGTPTSHCLSVCFSRQLRVFNTSLVLTKSSLVFNTVKTRQQLGKGEVPIHPKNAHMSSRHGIQYVARCVACAALTPVVWQ